MLYKINDALFVQIKLNLLSNKNWRYTASFIQLPSYSFLYFCVLLVYLCLVNDLSINKIEAPQNRIKHIKQISFLLFFVHSLKPQVRIRGYELYMTLSRNMEWTYMRRKENTQQRFKVIEAFYFYKLTTSPSGLEETSSCE